MKNTSYTYTATAVQSFQIHAREIGVFAIQIGPLADSARLTGDVRANKVLASARPTDCFNLLAMLDLTALTILCALYFSTM